VNLRRIGGAKAISATVLFWSIGPVAVAFAAFVTWEGVISWWASQYLPRCLGLRCARAREAGSAPLSSGAGACSNTVGCAVVIHDTKTGRASRVRDRYRRGESLPQKSRDQSFRRQGSGRSLPLPLPAPA
jgi:hypothetical protein